MKNKYFSLLFSSVIILGTFSGTVVNREFNNLTTSSEHRSSGKNREFDPLTWKKEMAKIKENDNYHRNIDFKGEYVDYFNNSKTYYLKQDIDYAPLVDSGMDIYNRNTSSIVLVDGSTFNGNNHQIKNRYDRSELEHFIQYNPTVFESFSNSTYYSAETSLYLFDLVNNVTVENLTFNNSPFVTGLASGKSVFHNVNLVNIDISGLSIKAAPFSFNGYTKQNSFDISLFAREFDSNVVLENSYFDNINISDNHFILNQNPSYDLGLSVDFSLVTLISDKYTVDAPVRFENLEYQNWTIRDNTVSVKNWKADFINKNLITFSPFFVGGSRFSYERYHKATHNNNALDSKSNSVFETKILVQNIYFSDFVFENNRGVHVNTSELDEGINLSLLPMFNDDGIIEMNFQTILINNINISKSSQITFDNYVTSWANTTISFGDLMFFDNIAQTLATLLEKLPTPWVSKASALITDQVFKERFFSSEYWNTFQDQELTLKKEPWFAINKTIKLDENKNPALVATSTLGNFKPTYFKYVVSSSNNNKTWKILQEKEFDEETIKGSIWEHSFLNKYFDISSLDINSDDYLKVDIFWGRDDKKIFNINTNQPNFFVYDFTNNYDATKQEFNYHFIVNNHLRQLNSLELSLDDSSTNIFQTTIVVDQNEDIQEINGSMSVVVTPPKTSIFTFTANYTAFGEHYSYSLSPKNGRNFEFGFGENYIKNFQTIDFPMPTGITQKTKIIIESISLVILIIILVIILFVVFKINKNKQEINKLEEAMLSWSQVNGGNNKASQEFIDNQEDEFDFNYEEENFDYEEENSYLEDDLYEEDYYQDEEFGAY